LNSIVEIADCLFSNCARHGERIERDMIAVRVTDELPLVVAGAPAYFAQRGKPKSPKDLVAARLHSYPICQRHLLAMAFSGQTPRFGSSRRGTIRS